MECKALSIKKVDSFGCPPFDYTLQSVFSSSKRKTSTKQKSNSCL